MASPSTSQRGVLILIAVSLCAGWIAAARRPIVTMPGGCGPTSLLALCRHLGIAATPEQVSRLFGGDFYHSSFAEMEKPARALGLQTQGLHMTIEELRRRKPLGILHVDGTHFVAVIGYEQHGIRIADSQERWKTRVSVWPDALLSARWDGRILVVTGKPGRRITRFTAAH